MGRTIGVVGLKGGVGKTSVVSALGDIISDFGKKVLLVDGNLSAPNLGLYFNVIDPGITLHHVLDRKANVKDAIYKTHNFDLIPSSIYYNRSINPLLLRDKIKHLKRKYDIILIDSSPSLNEETLAVILASDEVLVVTTPDYPTLTTTLKAVRLAKHRGTPISGVIINKTYNKDFELSVKDIESIAEVPVMAIIPYDVNVLKALSEFRPSTMHKPKSGASIEYRKLGATLIGEKFRHRRFRDIFKMSPKMEEVNREIYYERVFED